MIAIKPYAELMSIGNGVDALKKIEFVGRTCYKSTDMITDTSSEKFVSRLIEHGHHAMLEHASFCFVTNSHNWYRLHEMINVLESHGFSSFLRFTDDEDAWSGQERFLVSANVRAWRDFAQGCLSYFGKIPSCMRDMIHKNPVLFPEYQKDSFFDKYPTGFFKPVYVEGLNVWNELLTHCDVTVKFVVDRGISHEIVRHRVAGFAQESTRYCNYSKDKFGGEITFITPEFFIAGSPEWMLWKSQMECAEKTYMDMIELGVTPEKARTVLPNSLKTELIMTANCREWNHFFRLRACNSTGKAHPQMLEVARPLLDEFKRTIPEVFDELTYGE